MALFAEVTFSTEAIVAVGGLLGALAGAIGYIFRLLMQSKDAQIAAAEAATKLRDEESAKKSYKEIAEEAVAMAELRVNRERRASGYESTRVVAPVVPEHSSPVTTEQQKTADLQTLRARVTAATLALGLPAREPGAPEGGGPPVVSEPITQSSVEELKADVAQLKQTQLRADIAEVKKDVAEVPAKTAAEIQKQSPAPEG